MTDLSQEIELGTKCTGVILSVVKKFPRSKKFHKIKTCSSFGFYLLDSAAVSGKNMKVRFCILMAGMLS